jgi:hypothetical protein
MPGTSTEPSAVAAERIARMRCLPAVLDFDHPPRLRALLLFADHLYALRPRVKTTDWSNVVR